MTQPPGEPRQDDGEGRSASRPSRRSAPIDARIAARPRPEDTGEAADATSILAPEELPATAGHAVVPPKAAADSSSETVILPPPGAPGGPREHPLKPASEAAAGDIPPAPTAPPPPPPLTWDATTRQEEPPPWTPPPKLPDEPYPMRFEVAYPEALSRWKTLSRAFLIIPAALFAWLVTWVLSAVVPLGWVPVFLRRRYPEWMFRAGAGGFAYTARWWSYALLLTDRYPSFDAGEYPAQLEYDDPPEGRLSRWRVFLYKLFLTWPHFIVLTFLFTAVAVVTVLAWFAILFTGRYPRGLFGFVTGVLRWYYRVLGYFASFNDRFPPFSLASEAGPGARASAAVTGVLGLLILGGCTGGIVAAAIVSGDTRETTVNYAALQRGVPSITFFTGPRGDPTFSVRLESVADPADDLLGLADARDTRVVVFEWTMANESGGRRAVAGDVASLDVRVRGGTETYAAAFVAVDGRPASTNIAAGDSASVRVAFVIPESAEPVELRLEPPWNRLDGAIRYRFR